MQISFEDCKRELLEKPNRNGQAAYKEWRSRPGYDKLVEYVEGFTHRYLFTLSPEAVKKVMDDSEHPLGNVGKEEVLRFIEDFTCPFALQHVFHGFIEQAGFVPTWQEFEAYIHEGARDKWFEPLRALLHDLPAALALVQQIGKNEAWETIKRAIRWRLGKFYLSAMRELDLLTRIRELGVPVRYHLLADVLLRVDFWTDNTLVCVYFENRKYRHRKPPAERFFTGIDIIHAKIERQGFGRFWLATGPAVNKLTRAVSCTL
jgi:hypothetical protein